MAVEIKNGVILPYELVKFASDLLSDLEEYIIEDNLHNMHEKYREAIISIRAAVQDLAKYTIVHGMPESAYMKRMFENLKKDIENEILLEKKEQGCCNWCSKPVGSSVEKTYGSDLKCCAGCKAKGLDKTPVVYGGKKVANINESKYSNIDYAGCPFCGSQDIEETGEMVNWELGEPEPIRMLCLDCNKRFTIYGEEAEDLEECKLTEAKKRKNTDRDLVEEGYYFKKTGLPAVEPHRNPSKKYYLIDDPKSEWGFIVRHEDPEKKSIFSFNKSKELIDYINQTIFDGNSPDDSLAVAKDLVDEYHKFVGPVIFKYDK